MTLKEKAAYKHLVGAMKATLGRSDETAQEEARTSEAFSGWLTGDPDVRSLARDGYESFVEKTAERILADNQDEVFLNCCPRCHELARTPKAQQCRFCGLDWHPVNQHLA
jgi:hypothetical protein